jgi:hypothetical protein
MTLHDAAGLGSSFACTHPDASGNPHEDYYVLGCSRVDKLKLLHKIWLWYRTTLVHNRAQTELEQSDEILGKVVHKTA